MGYKYSRDEILAGALDAVLADGVSQLTFARVAGQLGINDRTVVYYFPTKADLIANVLGALGLRLQEALAPAVSAPAVDHRELVRRAWPLVARPSIDPVFAVFFEANGLAAAKRSPFVELVPQLTTAWIDWVMTVLDGSPAERRAEAEATIALLDGLLLVRQLAGPAAANRAAAVFF